MLQFFFLCKIIEFLIFLTPLSYNFSDGFICVIVLLGIAGMSFEILMLKLQKYQIDLDYQVNQFYCSKLFEFSCSYYTFKIFKNIIFKLLLNKFYILEQMIPTDEKKFQQLAFPYLGIASLQTRLYCKSPSKFHLFEYYLS